MDQQGVQDPKTRRQVMWLAISAVFAIALFISARWAQPERVNAASRAPGPSLGVEGDRALYVDLAGGMAIKAMSLKGGRTETLAPSFLTQGTLISHRRTANGYLLYVGVPASPSKGTASARIFDVRLDGSKPKELLPHLARMQRAFSSEHCFCLGSIPSSASSIVGIERQKDLPHDEEWTVTPLEGGPSKLIARIGSKSAMKALGDSAVALSFEDNIPVLRFASPPDFRCVTLKPANVRMLEELHELDGRVYWTQPIADFREFSGMGPWQLISVAADGTGRRVEYQAADIKAFIAGAHRGKLYLFFTKGEKIELTSFTPRTAAFRKIALLSLESQSHMFEDGYYYFGKMEHPDNWLDWSQAGLLLKTQQAMYRLKLPD